jgi:hypothetical protein
LKELTVIRKDKETSNKEINGNVKKVTHKLEELCGIVSQAKWKDDISRIKTDINMDLRGVRQELDAVKTSVTREDRKELNEHEVFKKLDEKEVSTLKTELNSRVKTTVIGAKENVEETLEIERRKKNLVIHGVPETDAEQDTDAISEILGEGLHTDLERHVSSVMRIGKLDVNRPRPIRLVIKSMDGTKQILARAKELKQVEE